MNISNTVDRKANLRFLYDRVNLSSLEEYIVYWRTKLAYSTAPPISSLLKYEDMIALNVLFVEYSSHPRTEKLEVSDYILQNRGFKRVNVGTNRVVYRHEVYDGIILKLATDGVGAKDNIAEMQVQWSLLPFVPRIYEVSKDGYIQIAERVVPITSRKLFCDTGAIKNVFQTLCYLEKNGYVMEDVGAKFFMNWGIRNNGNVVILDFPYIFKRNKLKSYCTKVSKDGTKCNGYITFDKGFDQLVCTKCGARYPAKMIGDPLNVNQSVFNKSSRKRVNTMLNLDNLVISYVHDGKVYTKGTSNDVILGAEKIYKTPKIEPEYNDQLIKDMNKDIDSILTISKEYKNNDTTKQLVEKLCDVLHKSVDIMSADKTLNEMRQDITEVLEMANHIKEEENRLIVTEADFSVSGNYDIMKQLHSIMNFSKEDQVKVAEAIEEASMADVDDPVQYLIDKLKEIHMSKFNMEKTENAVNEVFGTTTPENTEEVVVETQPVNDVNSIIDSF